MKYVTRETRRLDTKSKTSIMFRECSQLPKAEELSVPKVSDGRRQTIEHKLIALLHISTSNSFCLLVDAYLHEHTDGNRIRYEYSLFRTVWRYLYEQKRLRSRKRHKTAMSAYHWVRVCHYDAEESSVGEFPGVITDRATEQLRSKSTRYQVCPKSHPVCG